MRADMAKVVTERERYGSAWSSVKTGETLCKDAYDLDDHGSSRAPMRKTKKMFSDVLRPLYGYLRQQLGKPWDAVYSDLSQHLNRRSLMGIHIWTHIEQMVEIHAVILHGKPHHSHTMLASGWEPIRDSFYVHPQTHLLCYAPRLRVQLPRPPLTVKKLGPLRELKQLDGIWYDITYRVEPTYIWRRVGTELTRVKHGTRQVTETKRQLNKKTLKSHRLTNAPVLC